MVAPPSLHNLRTAGQLSFVTVSGGLNLYIGNNPAARGVYSEPPGLFLEKDITGASSASRMAGRTLDPEEASRYFAAQAWRYVRDQPGDALALWIRKAGYLVSPAEVPQIESVEELRAAYLPLRWLTPFGFAVLFPLALLGSFRWIGRRRTVQIAVAVVAAGALVHLIFFSTGRYRAAMLPALAVLAGGGIAELLDCFRRRRGFLQAGWPLALGLGLMLLSPRVDRGATRAWALHQAGVRYDQLGAARAAEESYRQALALDPTSGESWHNLAVLEAKAGRIAEAIEANEQALRHLGEHPLTLYNLGILYGRMGMDEKAITYLDRSLARDPRDTAVRVDHGVALYRLGRHEEAFQEWQAVAAENPRDPSLKRTLNRILSLGATLPEDLLRIGRTP
jgi:tetratricopeptide (TPR) repeat protein